MKSVANVKIVIAVSLLLAIALAIGVALVEGLLVTVPAGNYYPLAVGDEWTYRMSPGAKTYDENITQQMTIENHTAYAVVIEDEYSFMGKIGGSVYQFGQGDPDNANSVAPFDPPQLAYPSPFVLNDTWETPVPSEAMIKNSETVDVTGSVEGEQSVSVPAGTFKNCIRVLIDDPRDAPSEETEIWFAKDIGIVKTITYTVIGNRPPSTSTTELIKFHVQPNSN